jgi:hypothetical protein
MRGGVRSQESGVRIFSAAVALLAAPLSAQWLNYPTAGAPRLANGQPNFSAPAPRGADGKPDFSGLWENDGPPLSDDSFLNGVGASAPEFGDIAARLKDPIPYRPWSRELRTVRGAENGKDNPSSHCLPLGMVAAISHPYPHKILQVPGLIVILYERNVDYRQIFTDGRPLPVDPNPSFNGYSTGKWEGDTLVVETIGFRDDLWLDQVGNPLTESGKVTERFRRPDFGHMEIEITVDDPKAYTAPWKVTLKHRIKLDTELLEYYCENEKDVPHLVGK